MASLLERLGTKRFRLGVKQHALVLEFTTAAEDAMNASGITQSDLAKRLGKSRSWVSKIFRRKPNLTFFTAVEVADALEMDVEIRATRSLLLPNVFFLDSFVIPNRACPPLPLTSEPRATTVLGEEEVTAG